jgi:hypothetical protein
MLSFKEHSHFWPLRLGKTDLNKKLHSINILWHSKKPSKYNKQKVQVDVIYHYIKLSVIIMLLIKDDFFSRRSREKRWRKHTSHEKIFRENRWNYTIDDFLRSLK